MVFEHVLRSGPASRAQLARAVRLTRVSVSSIVDDLLVDGVLAEVADSAAIGPGPRGRLLQVSESGPRTLSVDLQAGARARAAFVDLRGTVGAQVGVEFSASDPSTVLGELSALCRRVLRGPAPSVLGIGLARTGDVAGRAGADLPARLAELLALPVVPVDAAEAAVSGEHARTRWTASGLLLVLLREQVTVGLLLAGTSRPGFAPDAWGHLVVDPRGNPCSCGRRGCLQTLFSAPLRTGGERLPRRAGRVLGRALAPVVVALDPDRVALAGPPAAVEEDFLVAVGEGLDQVRGPRGRSPVRRAGDDVEIVLRGAARPVFRRVLGIG